jgi:hypothetical protein
MQAPATHGNHHHVQVRHLLDQLESDGSLPRHHGPVVEGVNEEAPLGIRAMRVASAAASS